MGSRRETPFFWRNIAGRPAIIVNKQIYNGDFIWVDSGDANADNNVGSNEAPCSTYAGAEALATANQGDVIIIRPGHAESLTAAIALAKAGILTLGLTWGTLRPTFTSITNAVAALTVTGANRRFMGLRFICNIASQTESIDVAADDVIIDGNEFREGSATGLGFITADTVDNDSDRLTVVNNVFYAPTAGNYNQAIEIAKDHDEITIEGNKIYGDFDEACVQIPTAGNACTNIRIVGNELSNLLTGQHAIQIIGTAVTGRIARNECETDTQAATIDGAACSRFGNTWCDVDGSNDEEGIPVDAAIAGGVDDSTAAILVDTGTTLPATLGTPADTDLATDIANAAVAAGTALIITKTITSSDIPDDGASPLDEPLTGAASGSLVLEEIIMQTDGTGLVNPTTIQVVCDNAKGLTGGTVPLWDEATANLGANATINNALADVNNLPITLETTKKLYINGDDGVGTGGGTVDVTMVFRRITAGATIAAA